MFADLVSKYKIQIILLIFFVSLFVRLTIGFESYQNENWKNFSDDLAREVFAKSILNNGFVPELKEFRSAESIFAPFVPIIIAAKIKISGESWLPIFILNSFLGAFSCLMIYFVSARFFSQGVSLMALLWASFYPSYLRYIGTAGNEPWLVFLFLMTFLFALRTIEELKTGWSLILYSLSFTLLIHTDERYLAYSVLFSGLLLFGNGKIYLKARKIFLFSLFTILFSVPWLLRNYLVYNDIVLISCRTTSITQKFINHREEVLFFDHEPANMYLTDGQIDSIKHGLLFSFRSGQPIEEREINAIKEGNIPHQFSPVEKIFSRFIFLWMPMKIHDSYRINGYNFMPAWSLKHNLLTGISFGLLLPFMVIGLYFFFKKRRNIEGIIFIIILVYHTIIHIAFIPYARDRYRHPVDFIIIILGCYGINQIWNYLKSKQILQIKKV